MRFFLRLSSSSLLLNEEEEELEDEELLLSRRFRSRDTFERFASFDDDWLSLRTRDWSRDAVLLCDVDLERDRLRLLLF